MGGRAPYIPRKARAVRTRATYPRRSQSRPRLERVAAGSRVYVRSVPSNPLGYWGSTWSTWNRRARCRQTSHVLRTYDRNDISRLGRGGNVNGAMRGTSQAASAMSAERRGGSREVASRLRDVVCRFRAAHRGRRRTDGRRGHTRRASATLRLLTERVDVDDVVDVIDMPHISSQRDLPDPPR